MATEKDSESAKRDRVKAAQRAFSLRSKIKAQKPVTDDDRAWLDAYARDTAARIAERDGAKASAAAGDPPPPSDSPPIVPAAAPIIPEARAARPPAAPPLEAAPKIDLGERKGKPDRADSKADSGHWRDKYRAKGEDGIPLEDREEVCVKLASYWYGAVDYLVEGMRAAGVKPWFSHERLFGDIVLTTDHLLPAKASLKPEVIAVAGSTVLGTQYLLNWKKIREATKVQTEADAQKSKIDSMKREAETKYAEAAKRDADAHVAAKARDAATAAMHEAAAKIQPAQAQAPPEPPVQAYVAPNGSPKPDPKLVAEIDLNDFFADPRTLEK